MRIHAHDTEIDNAGSGNVIVLDAPPLRIRADASEIRVSARLEPQRCGNDDVSDKTSGNSRRVTVCPDYSSMSDQAARVLVKEMNDVIARKGRALVTFSMGQTPEMLYELLRTRYKQALDWDRVAIVEMDAYLGIPTGSVLSTTTYLHQKIIDPLGVKEVYRINNDADVTDEMLSRFEASIGAMGGIDVALHGIGRNGHIGFNEPGSSFTSLARIVTLSESTIAANSRHVAGTGFYPRTRSHSRPCPPWSGFVLSPAGIGDRETHCDPRGHSGAGNQSSSCHNSAA